MPVKINVSIKGDKEVAEAFSKLPDELEQAAQAAGAEIIGEILVTEGIQTYPPASAANAPPYPYYERGRGTWTSPGQNTGSSEQYGKRWTEPVSEGYMTVAKNTASYASYLVEDDLHPEGQAAHMGEIGWRQIEDVAEEKRPRLIEILEGWIDRAIELLGLGK